jgi:hypothetical protein
MARRSTGGVSDEEVRVARLEAGRSKQHEGAADGGIREQRDQRQDPRAAPPEAGSTSTTAGRGI